MPTPENIVPEYKTSNKITIRWSHSTDFSLRYELINGQTFHLRRWRRQIGVSLRKLKLTGQNPVTKLSTSPTRLQHIITSLIRTFNSSSTKLKWTILNWIGRAHQTSREQFRGKCERRLKSFKRAASETRSECSAIHFAVGNVRCQP